MNLRKSKGLLLGNKLLKNLDDKGDKNTVVEDDQYVPNKRPFSLMFKTRRKSMTSPNSFPPQEMEKGYKEGDSACSIVLDEDDTYTNYDNDYTGKEK